MKKLLFIFILFFNYIIYSNNLNDGKYIVIKAYNNTSIEMIMIVKNSKILSLSFDKKIDGQSRFVGSNSQKISKITSEIRKNQSLENVEFNLDDKTNKEIKELFTYLLEKSQKNIPGKYVLNN